MPITLIYIYTYFVYIYNYIYNHVIYIYSIYNYLHVFGRRHPQLGSGTRELGVA